MRLLLFPALSLISFSSWACTSIDLNNYTGPMNCPTLTVDSPVNFPSAFGPIEITVAGDVEINANMFLDGSSGNITSDGLGGSPGPGGTEGGNFTGSPVIPNPGGNFGDFSAANGQPGEIGSPVCGGGGGGAGMALPGSNGVTCNTSSNGVAGDSAVTLGDFDFGINFRGGFGGGSGADGSNAIAGTGGGGGGAIHIISQTGNITIASTATISAKGGNGGGGPGIGDGGGGGGGSGGAIWLQALAGTITVQGKLDVQGGKGGSNNGGIGGNGGDGGSGVYRIEASTGTPIEGTGTYSQGGSANLKSFSSDISCGTIAVRDNSHHNNIFQIALGFLLVMLLKFYRHRWR